MSIPSAVWSCPKCGLETDFPKQQPLCFLDDCPFPATPQHNPAPWSDGLTPLIPTGFPLIGGRPVPTACRILAEPNFQFAKNSVNAVSSALDLLEKTAEMLKETLQQVNECIEKLEAMK